MLRKTFIVALCYTIGIYIYHISWKNLKEKMSEAFDESKMPKLR